ncbi:surfeit locus protein 6 homolog [Mizuhopecten yessoensis]|uniref:Surfeit locus protein 6-like n=1 Tax=Mizuhopecten yessoensis TaxID=6573 RepID=A0A210PU34_MIZYE|nr:surfeit locus protein 6 homolog [Mizuhopecten yessoensis]OWF39954.1 Surfeit locus protein 6-like [Mizuhopecten yessoensis]
MQMKMAATTSDSLDAHSSIKNDLNFFKEWLATIDPSVFGTSTQELQDSDSAEDNQVKPTSKKQERTHTFNKTSSKKQTEPEQETEEEPYSKIKEKQKHKNSKMAKQRKQKTDARLLNIITPRQEDLQQKLRARIEELQGKRGLSVDEQKEKKKLKRKESLLKLKLRKKFEKQNKNKGNLAVQKETVVNGAVGSPNSKPVKPIYNKEGKLVFSKFDFTEAGGKDRGKSNLSGKDYKRLLEKLEKRKEHVEKVKEKDAEKGKQVETKMAWETAIHRAQGQKVKDDPALVKKALKKKEKIKKQKSKQWSQRDSQTKKRMETKIEKRTKNIEERKQQKKDKKNKRAKKKGRLIAGF